jgi:hypothetical protein
MEHADAFRNWTQRPDQAYKHRMKPAHQTIAVGLVLLVVGWFGSFSSGGPTLTCPMPTITILPAFFLISPRSPASHVPFSYWFASFVPVIVFFAWNPGLFKGNVRIPKRSWVLLVTLTVLSVVYFAASWRYGNHYQGPVYTAVICAVNVLWIVSLWAIWYRSWRVSSFRANLLFHATLFTWLAWYAFPYLGELP